MLRNRNKLTYIMFVKILGRPTMTTKLAIYYMWKIMASTENKITGNMGRIE